MRTHFVAETIEEAQKVFGRAFYEESLPQTQPELDERVQLGAFLWLYALSDSCQFPIAVNILPRDYRPDFKVVFGGAEVGVEVSKIANSELEEMRTVQRQRKLGTIETSSLLRPQGRRCLKQRIEACTGIPVFIFPEPDQTQREDAFWMEKAQAIVKRKHGITEEPTFNRYGESWLLLWDKMSYNEELELRVKFLADWLAPQWNSGFFAKIIIQEQHSQSFFILSQHGIETLQRKPQLPVTEFCLPDDIALNIDVPSAG